jgi:hypothetical protein
MMTLFKRSINMSDPGTFFIQLSYRGKGICCKITNKLISGYNLFIKIQHSIQLLYIYGYSCSCQLSNTNCQCHQSHQGCGLWLSAARQLAGGEPAKVEGQLFLHEEWSVLVGSGLLKGYPEFENSG